MNLHVKILGQQPYEPVYQSMQNFTAHRTVETPDELWIVEHPPVFTQGQAGKAANILNPGAIPVVQTDRGGQVTYHGPGQLVVYTLLDLKRLNLGIRQLVCGLEQIVLNVLQAYNITGHRKEKAPGIYVNGAKICAIGLRVKQMRAYHGIALNVCMDLDPFKAIHPCGYPDLAVTQLWDLGHEATIAEVTSKVLEYTQIYFGYQDVINTNNTIF